MREQLIKYDTPVSRFKSIIIADNPAEHVIKKAREYTNLLRQYHDVISGMYIDAGSICLPQPRLWVIVRSGIDESRWIETINAARSAGMKALSGMAIYIFDALALEVLLYTQHQWIFERSHLINHAVCLGGDNWWERMRTIPDALMLKMCLAHIIAQRVMLRQRAFYSKRAMLYRWACEILRIKVLIETNIIATTIHELSAASKALREEEALDSLSASIMNKNVSREALYVRLNNLLDESQKKLESSSVTSGG